MIAGNLEFLVSSLPGLYFNNAREFRSRIESLFHKYAGETAKKCDMIEIFEKEARKYLSDRSFYQLQKINLRSVHLEEFQKSGNRTIADFAQFMFALKKYIEQYRTTKTNNEKKAPHIFRQLEFDTGTPLEVEVKILQMQWDQLEDLGVGYHFDLETLILYKLKLQILMRWWSFNSEQGMKIFKQLTRES